MIPSPFSNSFNAMDGEKSFKSVGTELLIDMG